MAQDAPGSTQERIRIVAGDITTLAVDAIVNAANSSLAPGGGVCGAIHAAAGPDLARECATIGSCPTGEARLTAGYRLPARYVIHAVGPVWHGGHHDEDALLASAYRASLELAAQHAIQSIAFPAISTGIFGFPADRAARIAVSSVDAFLRDHALPEQVMLVCYAAPSCAALQAALATRPGPPSASSDR